MAARRLYYSQANNKKNIILGTIGKDYFCYRRAFCPRHSFYGSSYWYPWLNDFANANSHRRRNETAEFRLVGDSSVANGAEANR